MSLLLAVGACNAQDQQAAQAQPAAAKEEFPQDAVATDAVSVPALADVPDTADPVAIDPSPAPAATVDSAAAEAPAAAPAAESAPQGQDAGAVAAEAAVDPVAVAAAAAAARAVEEARLEAEAKARAEEARIKAEAAAKEEAALERRRISTRVFMLSSANAEEVAERFNATWSGDFGATWKVQKIAAAFPESNAVMVTAPKMILEACEKVIYEIDREAAQVYIEARFVELGNKASHKLGIDWSMLDGMSGTASFGGGMNSTRLGKGVSNFQRQISGKNGAKTETDTYNLTGTGSGDGDVNYFNGTLSFSEMKLVLMALDATDDVRMFSNPKIIVSTGKKATVDMTTKYPNVQVSAKRTLNGNAESLDLAMNMAAVPGEDKMMFAREAFFSWGISLDVTPRISTNGLINVTIVPTISSLDEDYGAGGFVTADSGTTTDSSYSSKYPIIKVQRLVTEFNMASGSTAVIGGLSRTVETQQDSGIPWLRTWPWIGPKLFGSKIRVKEQREIIVFVTVGLVDPKRMQKDAGLPKNAVLGRQYVKEQKLEPGDRPEKNMEGFDSLDMRSLEEQAKDPLKKKPQEDTFKLGDYMPFRKDPNYKRNHE